MTPMPNCSVGLKSKHLLVHVCIHKRTGTRTRASIRVHAHTHTDTHTPQFVVTSHNGAADMTQRSYLGAVDVNVGAFGVFWLPA
jgi:hypothetical protein